MAKSCRGLWEVLGSSSNGTNLSKKKKSLNGIKMFTCPIWKLNDSQISLCICSMTAAIKFVYIEILSKKVDNSRAQFYVKSVLV